MAKNIDTGLDDEEEINTGKKKFNTVLKRLTKDGVGKGFARTRFAKEWQEMDGIQRKKHFCEERAKAKEKQTHDYRHS
ncbi:hypothetical protein Tco_0117032 [Tanacetum coccineum]